MRTDNSSWSSKRAFKLGFTGYSTVVPGVEIMEIKVAARNREETSRLSAALWTPETCHATFCYLAASYPISPLDLLRYCHKQRLLIIFFSKCLRSFLAFYCHFVLNLF